jgi:ketosteroid isomerase-like protein
VLSTADAAVSRRYRRITHVAAVAPSRTSAGTLTHRETRKHEMEVTGGTFHIDLHAVFADDEHGVALVRLSLSRGDKSATTNDAHVFHLRDGKVTEFWDASTDQYAFDEVLG